MTPNGDNTSPVSGAIYNGEVFGSQVDLAGKLEGSLFRFCSLSGLIEGGHVTSAFLSTTFDRIECYLGLFNLCLFVDCQFDRCTFRGTSFPGCRFVDCRFFNCRFVPDNLGGGCVFDDTKWYGCLQAICEGLPDAVPKLEEGTGKPGKRSRQWR